ncbi:MAG: redoxin domain-containing protein, partial [Planctomycetota bacterium]
MKTARFAACLPLLFAPCATAAEIVPVTVGERIDLVAGQTADGCIWTAPAATPGEPGPFTAFVFLGTECPMAQSYGVVLSGLADEFADRGVHMVGVMSNAQDDAGEIIRFAQQQGVAFPLLHDPDAALADRFGATRTPEVFVLGPDRRVRYHGRIDDRLDRGANRGAALNTDLKNALTELSAGREVSQPETPFTGCRIGRRPKPQQTVVDAPTFKEHVAPLLHAKCAECHRPGQVAPFSMDKPEEVQLWAPTIAEAVAERRMPPWSADPRYGEWKHDLNLSSDEIAMLQRWSDAGAPLGDGEPPAFPSFPDGWLLGEPDLIVELPAYDVQPGEEDWWPKLSATVPLDGERWIQAIEVAPGNPKVVHHLGLSFGGMSTMGQAADDEGGSPRGGAGGRFGRGDAGGGNVDRRERFRQMLQQRRGGGGGRGGFGGRFGGGEPGGR